MTYLAGGKIHRIWMWFQENGGGGLLFKKCEQRYSYRLLKDERKPLKLSLVFYPDPFLLSFVSPFQYLWYASILNQKQSARKVR